MRSRSFQIAHLHGGVALLLALAACSPGGIVTPTRAAVPSASPSAARATTDDATHDAGDDEAGVRRLDTASILAPIEHRWQLVPLTARDAAANDMRNAFDLAQGLGESRVP